jgi:hypothetical protein
MEWVVGMVAEVAGVVEGVVEQVVLSQYFLYYLYY